MFDKIKKYFKLRRINMLRRDWVLQKFNYLRIEIGEYYVNIGHSYSELKVSQKVLLGLKKGREEDKKKIIELTKGSFYDVYRKTFAKRSIRDKYRMTAWTGREFMPWYIDPYIYKKEFRCIKSIIEY